MTKDTPRVLKKGLWILTSHSLNFLQMSKWCEINILSSRKWLKHNLGSGVPEISDQPINKSPLHKREKTIFSLEQYLRAFL